MAWRRIISKVRAAGLAAFTLVALTACGAASVVDIRSDGTAPPDIEVVDGTGSEPNITVPMKTDAQRSVPARQEAALGDGWSALLIDSTRASDKELQERFPSAPDLTADKQYLVAVVQVRYVGSETTKSTATVGAFVLDSFSKPIGAPCQIPLAEFVGAIDVPAGQAAVLYKCFIVDRSIGTDVVLGMFDKGTSTLARFGLDEPAGGSNYTPFDAASPFAIDDYRIIVTSATAAKAVPGATPALLQVTFEIIDAKPGAVGQLRFGLMSPGRGALATTNCAGSEADTPGTSKSSAAGTITICVLDRSGTGTLTGWVQATQTGKIVFFDVVTAP
jgi:hypothetical protein